LPPLNGSPISVRALRQLTAHRGELLSANPERGTPVHAASFIRRREIILEDELLEKSELPLIVVHEIFHFVWVRLSNAARASFTALLAEEFRSNARGELGESATVKKQMARGALTRDYVCESFCDSAAWLYASKATRGHTTLGRRWRDRRAAWFAATFSHSLRC
jgi:hypothetical protein